MRAVMTCASRDRFSRCFGSRASLMSVSRLTLLLALSLVSCKLPNVLAPQNPVDFCIEQAKSYCALEFRCCTATERDAQSFPAPFRSGVFVRHPPANEGDCVNTASDACRAVVDGQNEALTKERVKYDPDEASSCLDDLRKSVDECKPEDFFHADGSYMIFVIGAAQPGVLGAACEDVIRGNVDPHDTCFATYECKDGGCVQSGSGADVTIKGECDGTGHPENPFAQANINFEICDGLKDNEP